MNDQPDKNQTTDSHDATKLSVATNLRPGMSITCEEGHVIATAKEDTSFRDEGWADRIEWVQSRPADGQPARCEVCGGPWFFHHTTPAVQPPLEWRQTFICIEREWSAPLPDGAREFFDGLRDERKP